MLTNGIWLAGILIEVAVLVRGAQSKLLRRYPIFYCYIASVLLDSLVMYPIYRWGTRGTYAFCYWVFEFFAILFGSLLVFEISRVALRHYPGTARMARNALFFVFALAIAKAFVYKSNGALAGFAHAPEELERNLRIVQAFAILAIVCVLLLYRIPNNRNLKGILLGYGLFIASIVFELSLLSHFGDAFRKIWHVAQPLSYLAILGLWLYALWSAAPEPVARPVKKGYDRISAATRDELAKLQLNMPKAAR